MGVNQNYKGRVRQGPTKVSEEDLRTALDILSKKATGPSTELVKDIVGGSEYLVSKAGRTADDERRGRNLSTDAFIQAAEMPDPNFAARQAASRAKKSPKSFEPVDQTMSRLIGESLPPSSKVTKAMRDLEMTPKASGSSTPAAPTAPAATTRTRETLPSVDGPMRSISSGNRSIYGTMPKAEMGRDRAIGELSSDSAAMRSSAAASPDRDIDALFKKATGTTFDPKSRRDKAVRAELEAVLSSRPELADASDTKVALAWYNSKRK